MSVFWFLLGMSLMAYLYKFNPGWFAFTVEKLMAMWKAIRGWFSKS